MGSTALLKEPREVSVVVKVVGVYLPLSFSQAHQILSGDFIPAPPNYEKSCKSCPSYCFIPMLCIYLT